MSDALPIPDVIAQAHSRELSQRLVQAANESLLPFSKYMRRCLYEPGIGYYMAGSQKFGPDGDFVTSPEISPLFGACLAEQCAEILAISGGDLLELGAGSGRLALSVIQNLADDVWGRYLIVEPSADLQDRQRTLLQTELSDQQFEKIQWLFTLPKAFTGVIVANEVMDALPVDRVVRTEDGFEIETLIATGDDDSPLKVSSLASAQLGDELASSLGEALTEIENDLKRQWAPGYRSELSLLLTPWVKSLADCLQQGALLLVDYGYPRKEYYLEERTNGTLQCFYRHHAHTDVTFWPGLQDITAHVDFTSVVEAGDSAGLELLGYTAQAPFLFGCGLAEKANTQAAVWNARDTDSPASRIQHQQAINRLTLPGEMGEKFQVMALGRGVDAALRGFNLLDLSRRL